MFVKPVLGIAKCGLALNFFKFVNFISPIDFLSTIKGAKRTISITLMGNGFVRTKE